MKNEVLLEHRLALEHAALMDAAKQRALRLRAEAIDAFWSGLAGGLRRALHLPQYNSVAPGMTPDRATGASQCPR